MQRRLITTLVVAAIEIYTAANVRGDVLIAAIVIGGIYLLWTWDVLPELLARYQEEDKPVTLGGLLPDASASTEQSLNVGVVLPDIEITIGGFVTAFAWLPVIGEQEPPMRAAVWVNIVNRKQPVSLHFEMSNPKTGEKMKAETLASVRLHTRGPHIPGLTYIDNPQHVPAQTEMQGNLCFMWRRRIDGMDHQIFRVMPLMTITDSLSGKLYQVDLTTSSPTSGPIRRHSPLRE